MGCLALAAELPGPWLLLLLLRRLLLLQACWHACSAAQWSMISAAAARPVPPYPDRRLQPYSALPGGLDAAPPTAEEQQRVAAILSEPSSPTYWFEASRDGNREAHYRGPHLGATLMHPLLLPAAGTSVAAAAAGAAAAGSGVAAAAAGEATAAAAAGGDFTAAAADAGGRGGAADRRALVAAIDRFRRRVDAELPGMYVWFSDASLHITLRALIN